MKNPARLARYALYGLSCLVLVTAILIWNDRTARARQAETLRAASVQCRQTQRAVALLYRAFRAENGLTYAARAHTMAAYGDQKIKSVAWLVQAPDHLYVKYLDGHYKGMQFGYSQRWFYRQCQTTRRMLPYAEVEKAPSQAASQHFALLLENYRAEWVRQDRLQERPVEVVQIMPSRSIAGASGPAQRLWIDVESGLPLRTECFDYQLRPTLDTSLSEIDFSPQITPATFKAPAEILDMTKTGPWVTRELGDDRAAVEKATGLIPPEATYLPPGFVFDYVGIHLLDGLTRQFTAPPRPQDYAALARYTDGLNALTLFALRRATGTDSPDAGSAADNAAGYDFGPGTLVMRDVQDGMLAAVADLPPSVLRRVLASTPQHISR
jgi:hypothetical protein